MREARVGRGGGLPPLREPSRALGLPERRQAPTPARFASGEWGILIVANEAG
jgi:hypothetical protein